jgi:hypothetical protein
VATTSACLSVYLSRRIMDWIIGRIAMKLFYINLCGKYKFLNSCLRNRHTLRKWVCACNFHISWPVRMKFRMVYFHIMTSSSSEIDGSRRSEICTPLKGLNVMLPLLCTFCGALAKFRKATIMSVRPSVGPHGSTRLPLDGFVWNLIFEYFSIICRENCSYIKLGEEWQYCTRRPTYIFDHISLSYS